MVPLFDIFKIQIDGALRWCEAVESLETAKARVTALAQSAPAQYIIFDQQTAQRVIVDASGDVRAPQTPLTQPPVRRAIYHICRVENEKLVWIEEVDGLLAAESRIKVLKTAHPGDYLVLDYDPHENVPPPWVPLTCVLANYFISAVALRCISV